MNSFTNILLYRIILLYLYDHNKNIFLDLGTMSLKMICIQNLIARLCFWRF